MSRQYFDDGSWLETTNSGDTIAANWAGVPVSKVSSGGEFYRAPSYWTDAREADKLAPFSAQPTGAQPVEWWQSLAMYGATRAIDSHFGPPPSNRSNAPPTFAGQNGRTYSQIGNPNDTGAGGGGILPMLMLAGAAFIALG
jgi:hypothetical protein